MKKAFFLVFCMILPLTVQGQDVLPDWQMLREKSAIEFSVSIMGNPSEGEFTCFTSVIAFDPEHLAQSRAEIVIDMACIGADFDDVSENLKKPEWFDVVQYPKARFVSRKFRHLGGNEYELVGDLTLRDVTRSETLTFTLTEYDGQSAAIIGRMEISRLDFGIGQGVWRDTSIVAERVTLAVSVSARSK